MTRWTGVFPAVTTKLREDQSLDLGATQASLDRLIDNGVSFVEIGGNDEIMVTVLSAEEVAVPEGARELFAYALPADPDRRRTGLVVAVRRLHTVLPALAKAGAKLEHVYDY